MTKINPNFQYLKKQYIFSIVEQKWEEIKKKYPEAEMINFGVGDIALPLSKTIAKAIQEAVQEMITEEGKRGYGPSEGYFFLREAIAKHFYANCNFSIEEIFISDGTNTDIAAIQDLFQSDSKIAVLDPSYPAYRDISILSGKKLLTIPCLAQSGFIPEPPKESADLVYLCSPSNPTGVVFSKKDLQKWVDWAKKTGAILCIDSVYSPFISSPDVPKTIYEIEGAKEVAIELGSFSKGAGFTGLRCSYIVIPSSLCISGKTPLHILFKKRTSIKSNGVAYPIQKGALAYFSKQGIQETAEQIQIYLDTAKILRTCLEKGEQKFFGGVDSPYIFWQIPKQFSSWEFFEKLLQDCHILGIPGDGFGDYGEGFIRLSCFSTTEKAQKAAKRLTQFFYEISHNNTATKYF